MRTSRGVGKRRIAGTLAVCALAVTALAATGGGALASGTGSAAAGAQEGLLNLCKTAGTGVSGGQLFDLRVTLSGVTRIVTVPAGDCVALEVPRESSALGKGYFKNHPEVVANLVPPAVKLVVDGAELTAAQIQAIQDRAAKVSFASNLLLNLTQQLLATQLNILRGVQPPAQVSQAITDANAGVKIAIDGQGRIQLTTALTQSQMSALVTTLTAFNEGNLKGPATPSSADLQIVESIPADLEVSSIACDPSARCSNIDLDAGSVTATVVGGSTTTVTYTNRSSQPEPPPPPPPSGDSSQELIDRDLQDGVIDYPTSLVYRTWALFRDLRLPTPYAGAPSAGEDQSLFVQLEADFDILPIEAQEAVTPYLVPPNDPRSAFGPGPQPTSSSRVTHSRSATQALPFEETRCNQPASWRPEDWTPAGGGPNDGFRIWVCAASDGEAKTVFDIVKAAAAPLWEPMTRLGPEGMGKPVPDTVKGNKGFGNGKIDIWIVYTSDCVERTCPLADEEGGFTAGIERTLRDTCGETGYPAHSCSGYIVLNRGLLCPTDRACFARVKGTLAHEFFHVLQDAHNADAWMRETLKVNSQVLWEKSWYYEAAAMWAAWHYAKDPRAYPRFTDSFQGNDRSLLHFGSNHEYGSWVWPLLMQLEPGGASSVFESWYTAESATKPAGLDDAVDRTLPFADHFRDFSVRNLNPAEYFNQGGIGLEDDLWQTDHGDFPRTPHHLQGVGLIDLGDQPLVVEVAVLAAEDAKFGVAPNVRQVTIDVASLTNAGNADIDVVGRLVPDDKGGPPTWSRIRGSGTSLTFCRDNPGENFDLVYVVLSNHSRARAPLGGPDPEAALSGAHTITAKDHCDVPIRYEGTFKVIQTSSSPPSLLDLTAVGKVTFKYASTEAECGSLVPPTPITSLHHCYYLDSAQETWTAPSFSTDRCKYSPHDAHFSYGNDEGRHGGIDITIRNSFFPEFSNTYDVSFGSSTKTMVVDVTDVNPEQECDDSRRPTFTIGLPFYSINSTCNSFTIPPERFTGWPLRESRTCEFGQTEITTVTYSWELQPIFDTETVTGQ